MPLHLFSRNPPYSSSHTRRPLPPWQALSTLGMLLGSGAAAAAFQATGRSYTATFALSVVPALAGLALVVAAFGGDAKAAASARREQGARVAGDQCGYAACLSHPQASLQGSNLFTTERATPHAPCSHSACGWGRRGRGCCRSVSV